MSETPAHGLASGFERPDASPGLLLWQVTNRWQAAQRAALRPFELTHVQFVLLASLTWLGVDGPVSQRQLAEHAAADAMMTSQVLRALEARGFVTRARHPGDGRAVVAVEACDAAFFAAAGDGVGTLTALLRLLAAPRPG